MKEFDALRKLITVLGIANSTFGGVLNNKILMISGGALAVIGAMMIFGIIKC